MMSAKKPETQKTAIEPLEIEPAIEKEVNKNASNKPSITKSSEAIETKEAVETIENEVKTAIKKSRIAKAKVIKRSFSFPEQDYLKISELKKTCLAAGIHVKKGKILRAGLLLLTNLNLAELKQVLEQVDTVQTGQANTSKI
jgi:hypothetical protein